MWCAYQTMLLCQRHESQSTLILKGIWWMSGMLTVLCIHWESFYCHAASSFCGLRLEKGRKKKNILKIIRKICTNFFFWKTKLTFEGVGVLKKSEFAFPNRLTQSALNILLLSLFSVHNFIALIISFFMKFNAILFTPAGQTAHSSNSNNCFNHFRLIFIELTYRTFIYTKWPF